MILRCRSIFFLFAALVPGALNAGEGDRAQSEQTQQLIQQLGDSSFQMREAASEKILKQGEPALPALRIAARESRDLEVQFRAQTLVSKIMVAACQSRTTGMRLVLLRSGEFTMGSPVEETGRADSEDEHRVKITHSFLIGAHEVTQQQYRSVVDTEPSWFAKTGEGKEKVAKEETSQFPVDSVSWFDAIAFCNQLSRRDGLPLYHELTDVQTKNGSIHTATVKVAGGIGYRLPTEAEWEFAARAGTTTPYQFGEEKGARGNFQRMGATLYGSRARLVSLGRTTAVGSYPANLWGLHDMHGNVAEWCWDWYDAEYYRNSPAADPAGPSEGKHRVLRGGSWLVKQSSCRAASRFWQVPREGKYYAGFRVARNPSHYMVPAH